MHRLLQLGQLRVKMNLELALKLRVLDLAGNVVLGEW